MITQNKLNMDFLSAPKLVPWFIFNVIILGIRAWICHWSVFPDQTPLHLDEEGIKEREDDERGAGAIVLNIFV